MGSQVEVAHSRWLAPASMKKPLLVTAMRRYIESSPVEGYAGWCLAIRDLDVTDRLKAINLPTLVIVGSADPSTPPAAAQVIHREIAGSELVEVPGVSHQLHVEEPATFNKHVLEFLDRQPPSREAATAAFGLCSAFLSSAAMVRSAASPLSAWRGCPASR
jgi:3-oxoadipate enol-lactonase